MIKFRERKNQNPLPAPKRIFVWMLKEGQRFTVPLIPEVVYQVMSHGVSGTVVREIINHKKFPCREPEHKEKFETKEGEKKGKGPEEVEFQKTYSYRFVISSGTEVERII